LTLNLKDITNEKLIQDNKPTENSELEILKEKLKNYKLNDIVNDLKKDNEILLLKQEKSKYIEYKILYEEISNR
jgi:hypothetical protein